MVRSIVNIVRVLLFISQFVINLCGKENNFELSVIHFNDFHDRFEEMNPLSGPCHLHQTNCMGGYSRLYAQIEALVSKCKKFNNCLVLNAGDNYKGSLWYHTYKWNASQHFLNKLPTDAMVVGNHDFDDAVEGLTPFLVHMKTPAVVTNIDTSKEVALKKLIKKSLTVTKNRKKIGLVGVLCSTLVPTSLLGKLKFIDEIKSIEQESKRLYEEENVFTVIVISHCGYWKDMEIATKISSKISLIVGGHTHTLLYSGTQTPFGPDKSAGPYPTLVKNKLGNNILIVQASAFTKYLGNLSVSFDSNGSVDTWSGSPIFLNENVLTDKLVDEEIKQWKGKPDEVGDIVLGQNLFRMPQNECFYQECLLGNFVTDAMVFYHTLPKNKTIWSEVAVAIIPAGSLFAGLEKGPIRYKDLVAVQPFDENIAVGKILGKYLWEYFNSLVANTQTPLLTQVSGLQVYYNLSKSTGNRLDRIKIRCSECSAPSYTNLIHSNTYKIIVPEFMIHLNAFPIIKNNLFDIKNGPKTTKVLENYVKVKSPIYEEVGWRINIK